MEAKRMNKKSPDLKKAGEIGKASFPRSEYFSPKMILRMRRFSMELWGLYADGEFVGYMAVRLYEKFAYLMFLCIDPEKRCRGYGSEALAILKGLYPGKQHIVDFEMPDESADNNEQRIRRRNFYLRNGYLETGKVLSYGAGDFEIFCRDPDFDFDLYKKMFSSLSRFVPLFNPKYYDLRDESDEGGK